MLQWIGKRRLVVRRVATALTVLAAAGVLWNFASETNFTRTVELLKDVGFGGLLLFLSIIVATLADSVGWKLCLPARHESVGIFRLFCIRWASDALSNSLPAGAAVAEPLRPYLLHKTTGMPVEPGIASCVIMKGGMAIAQAMFFMVGGFFAIEWAQGSSSRWLEGTSVFLIAAFLVGGAGAGLVLAPRYFRLSTLLDCVVRGSMNGWRGRVADFIPRVKGVEHQIGSFASAYPLRLIVALSVFCVAWFALASEAFIILILLGENTPFLHTLGFEITASAFRIAFFALPGGLGAQEVGVVGVMEVMGIPDPLPLAAAFIVLRRAREVCWLGLGFLVLGRLRV